MAMSRRSHGFLMARQSYGNLGVSTELLGVLVGDCLYSNCALTTLPLRVSSCHGAHTAYALCFTALPLLWWRFVCMPCSNLKVITPGPPPSSSAEPAFRQAVALVDCAHQQWHSIFPKPKSYIFVHAGINNTLIIPLIQIYVMRIPIEKGPSRAKRHCILHTRVGIRVHFALACDKNVSIPNWMLQHYPFINTLP